MADKKEPSLAERAQKAVDSPVGQHVLRVVQTASGADWNQQVADRIKKAWKERRNKTRSSGR